MKSEPSFEVRILHSNMWLIAGCFIVFIFSYSLTNAFSVAIPIGSSLAEWESLSVPEEYIDGMGLGFDEIKFINSTHGWLLGYNALLQTTDSGESWSATLELVNGGFHGLSVVTPLNIWTSGSGLLRHTLDGGVTWNTVNTPELVVSTVEFYNITHGIVGDIHRLYCTTNGGFSWESSINWSTQSNSIHDIHLSATTVRVATRDGHYLSEDWGLTWEVVDTRETQGFSFITESEGWIIHHQFVSHLVDGSLLDLPRVARLQIPSNSYYNDIEFIDSEHGWVVGSGPAVMYTPDGGISWYEQDCPDYDFRSVDFINATHGWAAGWRGAVARTVTGNSLGLRLLTGFPFISAFTGGGILIPYTSLLVGAVSTMVYPFLICILRRKIPKNRNEPQEGVQID